MESAGDTPPLPSNDSTTESNTSHNNNEVKQELSSLNTTTSPPPPSDEELLIEMREIIKGSDLSAITFRVLKELLEKKFGQDLEERRAFIRENIIKELHPNEDEEGEDHEEESKEETHQEETNTEVNNNKKIKQGMGSSEGNLTCGMFVVTFKQ